MSARPLLMGALVAATLLWPRASLAGIVPGYDYVPGEVILKFKSNATATQKEAVRGDLRSQQLREFHGIRAEHLRLDGMTVQDAIARFEKDPRVEYIEPNYILRMDTTPNDPLFPDLWGMNNTGQAVPGGETGTPDADIDAVEAWSVFTGSSDVLVCVIDTGVNHTHPDLAANMWVNPGEIAGNGIDDDSNGFIDDIHGWDFVNDDNNPMDDNGHGSHCAGTIGGVGDNGIGVTGVNWNVRIMGAKFLNSAGSGSTADAISCIEYATMMGADVLSNSWGGGPFEQSLADAIQAAYDEDIFFVAAAGNDGGNNDVDPHYPSNYTHGNVISVMATDQDDNRVIEPGWWSSNYGATSVDIAAPGLYIWSTVLGTGYDNYSGTSMATPHVSGALAMLRGRFPNITVDAGKSLLLNVGRDVLPQLSGLSVTGARLNLLKLIADPDTIPPGAVTDLAASAVASNWVDLQWTAPPDDGTTMTGTCSSYDLRYSTALIDDTNWDAATRATGEPDPAAPGTQETFRVLGLSVSTPYYFAIKALDEYGNEALLSNVATATTLGPPTIAVAPASLSATLETGGTTSQTLTVSNVGEGVLDFTVGTEYIFASKPRFASVRQFEFAELPKNSIDSRQPVAPISGLGGPDAFGYSWRDSDEPGGPAYNWIEISSVGTAITLDQDDQNAGGLPIGFPFPFYGNDFTTFNVCTNGWVSFTSTAMSYSNSGLPASAAPENLLALFWDDLTFTSGGDAYYYNDGTRLIIEYKDAPLYSGGGTCTMQLHLYPSGLIEYHYQSMGTGLASGTIGIQDASGTDGLTVVYNAAYVHDSLAIRFASVAPWVSTGPNSGSVAAGASVDLTVTFDATGLCGSHFDANLHLASNDPVTPDKVVPLGLDLIGTPDIQASSASLDFGSVYITASSSLDLTVSNEGCADLHITSLSISHGDFSTTVTPFTLGAGQSQVVPMVFAPTSAGPISGTLTLASDDSDSPSIDIALAGVGLEFPDIAVAPTSLSATLPSGGTSVQTLRITNSGAGALDFSIPEPTYLGSKAVLVRQHEYRELAKGAEDAGTGGPVITGSGGPDVFGYRWKDSDESGGPAYNWIEISGVGTPLGFTSDDQNLSGNPIGFTFPFYGNDFTTFNACTNGWVSFTSTVTSYSNSGLPATGAPLNLLALFWDDLTFSTSGDAYYYNDGTRLIVQYTAAPRLGGGGSCTMQLHLYPSGRIEFHYQTMPTTLNSATIGIQNATGTDGLQVVYNAAYLHDTMAIRFESQPPWLSAAPASGSIPPGNFADIEVTFNATGFCGGTHNAELHVLSNDPDSPDVAVPAALEVTGTPDGTVSAASLDLGSVRLTQSASLPLAVTNAGCGTLEVTALTIDNPAFTVDVSPPFGLAPGANVVMNVTYAPTVAGPDSATLTIACNDPSEPEIVVALSGSGVANPTVAVSPASMTEQVPRGEARTRTLTIENNGDGVLEWSIPAAEIFSKVMPIEAANEYRELPKEAADLRTGGPVILGAGGPDASGYRWKDSDEPGGPTYNWVDIAATGTVAITSGDDVNTGPFPIGFTFNYYGTDYTTFRVCSNGWLSFTSSSTARANSGLPSAGAPANLVAPFWDDLTVAGTARVYYQNVGGALVVQWNAVPHYGSPAGGPYTFQVILDPDGSIVFQYNTLGSTRLNECTVGIQNATGTVGLQCAFNTAYLHDSMAIRFTGWPEWVTALPVSGTIPPHSSADISIEFDATEVDYGLHYAQLMVQSNDLGSPEVAIPLAMEVVNVTAVEDVPLPTVLSLAQNVPNPFNPTTRIEFSLPAPARVDLQIFDVRGALVRTLVAASLSPGVHAYPWDGRADNGRQVVSGTYFYRLQVDGQQFVRRMNLIK